MTRKILLAATMLAPLAALPAAALAQPISGIYIGAGAGANFEQRETLQQSTTRAAVFGNVPVTSFSHRTTSHDTGVAGVGSVGYGFGNGLRIEAEGDYRQNRIDRVRSAGVISSGGQEDKYGGMVNALFDLDVGSPYVFPYIGGGAGYMVEDRQRRTRYSTVNVAGPSNNTLTLNNAILNSSGTSGSFAYQAIAGLSFPVPRVVGLSLTAEYRFFALDGDRNFRSNYTNVPTSVSARFRETDNYNHSLMLGVRYAFNVAPPAVVAAPVPAAPATASRNYLIFFDWDRADLTDRARQIISEAAQATTRTQVTRIEVSGHTDTTGTARYNQGLSIRRAQNVATELVRLGVPRASITTQGFGFSRPLISTGPGVREPQNRRVEIILR